MSFATAQSQLWGALSWLQWMAGTGMRPVVLAGRLFIWHAALWRTSKQGSRRHFLAFRAATPGAETGLCFGVNWPPDVIQVLQPGWWPSFSCPQGSFLCFSSDTGWHCLLPTVSSLNFLLFLSFLHVFIFPGCSFLSCPEHPIFPLSPASSSFLTLVLFVGNEMWPLEGEPVNKEGTSTVPSPENRKRSQRCGLCSEMEVMNSSKTESSEHVKSLVPWVRCWCEFLG